MKDLLNFFDKPKDPLSFTGIPSASRLRRALMLLIEK